MVELDDDEAALAANLDGPEFDDDITDYNKFAIQNSEAEAEIDNEEEEEEEADQSEYSGSFVRQKSYFEGNGVTYLFNT